MKLEVFDKTYDCTSITCTGKDSLEAVYIAENGGNDAIKFGGIADMTVFRIKDGDNEFTAADLDTSVEPAAQLRADVDYIAMMMEVAL